MKQLFSKWWVWVIIVVVVVCAWLYSGYNRLVSASLAADNQWSKVEVQYQRRLDLIPNLVATVKGVTKQELSVFGEIAQARDGYAGATTVDQKVAASNQVESALGRLLAITENYPTLRSSDAFNSLMVELSGTENRISVERGRFNDTVTAYNTLVKTFPNNLVAGIFGFKARTLFQAEEGASAPVKVDFSN